MQQPIFRFLWYWIPPAGWAAAIFTLSSISLPQQAPGFPMQDKVAHYLVFGILAFLVFRALAQGQGVSATRACWIAFAFTALYGALDEFHQSFVPMRSVEFADWLADAFGGALVFLTCLARPKSGKGSSSP